MKFSTRGEYGLRSAANLARHYPRVKTVKTISSEERISVKYLERLMGNLRRGKIVRSIKGQKGGYVLADKPENIKVGQVIECTEGPITIKCYGTKCKNLHNCPSSFVWVKLGAQIRETLYGIKLSDLV